MKTYAELSVNDELGFESLTAEQAQAWRRKHGWSRISMWQIVMWQVLVGFLLVVVTWFVFGSMQIVFSVAYGVLVVVLPAAVFVLGVGRATAASGFRVFLVWEFVKLVMSVALLLAAQKLVVDVSWLALLLSMIVTIKTYWVMLLVLPRFKKPIN
jgi:ATP synthase protein I